MTAFLQLSVCSYRAYSVMLLLLLAGSAWAQDRAQLPARTEDGFAVPQFGHKFLFPKDHGSHPEFKVEWWYITGHLFTDDARRFGFQATFFRRSGPQSTAEGGSSTNNFGHGQIYLAHMALLDVKSGRFIHQERLNREGWDAAAEVGRLNVRNGNWSLVMTNEATQTMELKGSVLGEAAFHLTLHPNKPLVVFGENSVSRKAADPTAASYYLTYPRLETGGELKLTGEKMVVKGQAWMDHEISSSQLAGDQVGWDWASIQLNDGREIMAYRMRRKDGSTDPYSTLAWVDAKGAVTHVAANQFQWQRVNTWKSPLTGAEYPVESRLSVRDPQSGKEMILHLVPLVKAQELTGGLGGIAYWEGACRVLDEQKREIGSAFVELTGYAGNLSDRFR